MAKVGAAADPLAALDDVFDGSTLDAKWNVVEPTPGTNTISVHDGELDYQISAGGSNGSFHFDDNNGSRIDQEIAGTSWDARMRASVRNTADDGVPPSSGYRLAGLQVADPNSFNYVHVMSGTFNGTPSRIEWKSTDDSDSAFASPLEAPDVGLDLDFRIVRNGQLFTLYIRDSALAANLLDDNDWLEVQAIDREDPNTPSRALNGGTLGNAVALPDPCVVGPAVYSNVAGHDVRAHVLEFTARTV
jgi:hypothetical protein